MTEAAAVRQGSEAKVWIGSCMVSGVTKRKSQIRR
jgi:hypothetical protein